MKFIKQNKELNIAFGIVLEESASELTQGANGHNAESIGRWTFM